MPSCIQISYRFGFQASGCFEKCAMLIIMSCAKSKDENLNGYSHPVPRGRRSSDSSSPYRCPPSLGLTSRVDGTRLYSRRLELPGHEDLAPRRPSNLLCHIYKDGMLHGLLMWENELPRAWAI